MKTVTHSSAKPSHYNKEAQHYDKFNAKNSLILNAVVEKILRQYKVNTVLDLTCGTGSQVFYLTQQGYHVVGSDINAKMLAIAKDKARKAQLKLNFSKGDMRTTHAGQFDAVITLFNAIGHLTQQDFIKAIQNIHTNLKNNGIYIFDIFNLSYLLTANNITKLTIDWQRRTKNSLVREIQYSTINHEGVLASYDIYYEQLDSAKPRVSKAFQTLQVYSAQQLKTLLEGNGFKVLKQCSVDGSRLNTTKTERVLTVAKKLSL